MDLLSSLASYNIPQGSLSSQSSVYESANGSMTKTTGLRLTCLTDDPYLSAKSIQEKALNQYTITSTDDEEEFHSLTSTQTPPTDVEEEFHSIPSSQQSVHGKSSIVTDETDEEDEVDEDEYDVAALTEQALETQEGLKKDLNGMSPTLFIRDLPGQNILTAQFRRDQQGTIDLIGCRLTALEDNMQEFYFKGDAPQMIKAMLDDFSNLEENPTEENLLIVIKGLREYETARKKDSWLEKLNICFIGIKELLATPLAKAFTGLLPAEVMEADGESLLVDPTQITHQNRGKTSSDPSGLARNLMNFTQQEASRCHDASAQALLDTLRQNDYPHPDDAVDPRLLIDTLARRRPDVVFGLFHDFMVNEIFQAPADQQEGLRQELQQIDQAGENPEELLKVIEALPALAEIIAVRAQHQYLADITEYLVHTIEEQIQAHEPLAAATISGHKNDLNNARTIATKLAAQKAAQTLAPLASKIELLEALPCHHAIESGHLHGEQVWYLNNDIELTQTAEAISSKSAETKVGQAIVELEKYRQVQPGCGAAELTKHMKSRDQLLKSQIDALLDQARTVQHVKGSDEFEKLCGRIRYLESERPDAHYLDDEMDNWSKAANLGGRMLKGNEIPTEHILQELELERALIVKGGYAFNDEAMDLLGTLPSLGLDLLGNTVTAGAKVVYGLKDLIQGKVSPSQAAVAASHMGKDGLTTLAKTFQKELTAAAAIGAKNPRIIRALAGNLAQAKSVALNTLAGTSPVIAMFDELHNRVWAEAATTHFLENVNHETVSLDNLTDEELAAVKKILTICKLMEAAPYFPTLLDAAFKTYQNGTNLLAQCWTWSSAGAKLVFSRIVKNVNTMDAQTVRDCNYAMDIMSSGLAVANTRQRMMQRCGSVLADIASKHSIPAVISRAVILEPFKSLFNGFREAFGKLWRRERNSLTPFLIQAGKVTSVFGPTGISVGVAVATIFTGGIAGVFASFSMLGGSIYWAWHRADTLNHHEGLLSLASRVTGLVEGIATRSKPAIDKEVDKVMSESGYRDSIEKMSKAHAYRNLHKTHWNKWVEQQEKMFREAEKTILEQQQKELQGLKDELEQIKSKSWELTETDQEWLDRQTKQIKDTTELNLARAKHTMLWMQDTQNQKRQELQSSLANDEVNQKDLKNLNQQREMLQWLENKDFGELTVEQVLSKLPETETLIIPQDKERRIFWLMALEERYRENLYHRLGTEELPLDKDQLQDALVDFMTKSVMGSMVKQYYKPAHTAWTETWAMTRVGLVNWAKQRMNNAMSIAMKKVLTSVYSTYGKGWCSEEGMLTKREFEKGRKNNRDLDSAITSKFNNIVSTTWEGVFTSDRKNARNQLKGRGFKFGERDLPAHMRWAS
ncbi:hypothetical protein [Parendozoicomonas sp. Alg238-R29]|uniref:hypothetical protein n=1 Tax=Parendozoicomonas sp. Alg238-R29 TaxID=2993446 RepID=UPI00248D45F3|nr:hypothetical protein [Parendozoicomonas sp. Alg238-R29]